MLPLSQRGVAGAVHAERGVHARRGAAHAGRMFRENVRGLLRFIAKHEGARAAARTRWIVLAGCLLRAPRTGSTCGSPAGSRAAALPSCSRVGDPSRRIRSRATRGTRTVVVAPGARRRVVRPARTGDARRAPPGWLIARALGLRSASATLAWSLAALTVALALVFVLHGSFWLALLVLLVLGLAPLAFGRGALYVPNSLRSGDGTAWLSPGSCSECSSGTLRRERSRETRRSTSRASGSSWSSAPSRPGDSTSWLEAGSTPGTRSRSGTRSSPPSRRLPASTRRSSSSTRHRCSFRSPSSLRSRQEPCSSARRCSVRSPRPRR